MPFYRHSSHPYVMSSASQTDYPQEMVPQIIAHYKIQLQLELQKLQDIEKSYKLKFQEMERRIVQAQREKKVQNVDKVQDQSLQRQVQNKKKQIEYLTRKLQNLRKMPFNILNSIDELLIPHESPYTLINAKKKEIKQLQNQLARSQNIFQGKYMIEHKLINEYETQLALNKKLKLLREEKEVIREKSLEINRKKLQNTMINADYKKKSEELIKQIEDFKYKICGMQNQTSNQSMRIVDHFVNDQQVSKVTSRISLLKPFSYKDGQNYGALQSLEIERLQLQLKEMINQNEDLVKMRKQKDMELKKMIENNENMAEQRSIISKSMAFIFGQREEVIQRSSKDLNRQEEVRQQDFYSRTNRKTSEFNQQPETSRRKAKEKEDDVLESQVKQEEGLLQSLIKFFSRRTRASQEKQEKQKSMGMSREENQNTPRYSMMREQDSRLTDKFKSQEIRQIPGKQQQEERQKVHEKYLAQIQQQSIITDRKQANKYDKFDLGTIYKKSIPTQQNSTPNSSQQHVTFDLN